MAELPENKMRQQKQQLLILLDYIEDNPTLVPGIVNTANVHLWNDLARQLNSVSGGWFGEVETWVKWWNNVKAKALERQSELQSSCDEGAVSLTPNYLRVLRIIGDHSSDTLAGDEYLRERSPIRYQERQSAHDDSHASHNHSLASNRSSADNSDESIVSKRQANNSNKTLDRSRIGTTTQGKKEFEKKRTPVKLKGFQFLLSKPEGSNSTKSGIIDLTKEESPEIDKSLNVRTEEAMGNAKQRTTLCNHCTELLQEYITEQKSVLRNRFEYIGVALDQIFLKVTKNHENKKE